MGTPDFAVESLEALVKAGHDVAAVVTQPDKPKGRSKSLVMPPVKAKALEHGIPVYQPERIRKNEEFLKLLTTIAPEVIVVAAFGQILPKAVLELPKYGCVNVHASLLPMYRGAAPIQRVIINGEKVSGVTTMQMGPGLDTGDMLLKQEVPIEPFETYGSYHDKLASAGAKLLLRTLDGLRQGTVTPVKQEGETCYASMIDRSTARIDWSKPAVEIERLVRGLNPAPCAFCCLEGKTLKIWSAKAVGPESVQNGCHFGGECGKIVSVADDFVEVLTGEGNLRIYELQLEGKKRMDTAAFLRGYKIDGGMKLQ